MVRVMRIIIIMIASVFRPKHRLTNTHEILGFPLTTSMLTDLENLDLLTIKQKPANNIFTIESHKRVSQAQLREHLKNIGANVEHKHLPVTQLWVWEEALKVRVPPRILQSMVSWISEVYS